MLTEGQDIWCYHLTVRNIFSLAFIRDFLLWFPRLCMVCGWKFHYLGFERKYPKTLVWTSQKLAHWSKGLNSIHNISIFCSKNWLHLFLHLHLWRSSTNFAVNWNNEAKIVLSSYYSDHCGLLEIWEFQNSFKHVSCIWENVFNKLFTRNIPGMMCR